MLQFPATVLEASRAAHESMKSSTSIARIEFKCRRRSLRYEMKAAAILASATSVPFATPRWRDRISKNEATTGEWRGAGSVVFHCGTLCPSAAIAEESARTAGYGAWQASSPAS